MINKEQKLYCQIQLQQVSMKVKTFSIALILSDYYNSEQEFGSQMLPSCRRCILGLYACWEDCFGELRLCSNGLLLVCKCSDEPKAGTKG